MDFRQTQEEIDEFEQWEASRKAANNNWVNATRELVVESAAVDDAKLALIINQMNLMMSELQRYMVNISSDIKFKHIVEEILEQVISATNAEAMNVEDMERVHGKY